MANKRISQLQNVTASGLTLYDLLAIVNYDVYSGTTKNIRVTDLKSYINSGITNYTYEIGQYVPSEGGVVFHRDTYGGQENYLVVDINDLSTSSVWSNIDSVSCGADSLWRGGANTEIIINQLGTTSGAAFLCVSSTSGGVGNWYLPAIQELNRLWDNMLEVSRGLETASGSQLLFDVYWSSTEYNNSNAFCFLFEQGYASPSSKSYSRCVRAVRKFSI